ADGRGDGFDSESGGSRLESCGVVCSPTHCRLWGRHEGDPGQCGCNFFKRLHPLAAHLRLIENESRDIPPGMRNACDVPGPNWIRNSNENDRNCARLPRQGRELGIGKRENYVRPKSHYLCRVDTGTLNIAARPTIIHLEVAPLRPPKLIKL